MIKIHRVEIALLTGAISLFLFFGFSLFVNSLTNGYEEKVREVRRSQTYASQRLTMTRREVIRQRRRADSLEVILEAQRRPEVLWTARALLSETRKPSEMWYVAWVIRNRYESRFRNSNSYKQVVLDPMQFSAFNRGRPTRDYYTGLKPTDRTFRWHAAMKIAKTVIDAPESLNPIPKDTFHFYSEVSMKGAPHWRGAVSKVETPLRDRRFKFFQGHARTSITSNTAR